MSCHTDIRDQTVVHIGSDQCSSVCGANTTVELIEAPPSSATYSLNGEYRLRHFIVVLDDYSVIILVWFPDPIFEAIL